MYIAYCANKNSYRYLTHYGAGRGSKKEKFSFYEDGDDPKDDHEDDPEYDSYHPEDDHEDDPEDDQLKFIKIMHTKLVKNIPTLSINDLLPKDVNKIYIQIVNFESIIDYFISQPTQQTQPIKYDFMLKQLYTLWEVVRNRNENMHPYISTIIEYLFNQLDIKDAIIKLVRIVPIPSVSGSNVNKFMNLDTRIDLLFVEFFKIYNKLQHDAKWPTDKKWSTVEKQLTDEEKEHIQYLNIFIREYLNRANGFAIVLMGVLKGVHQDLLNDEDVPADIPADVPADIPADIPADVPADIPADVHSPWD